MSKKLLFLVFLVSFLGLPVFSEHVNGVSISVERNMFGVRYVLVTWEQVPGATSYQINLIAPTKGWTGYPFGWKEWITISSKTVSGTTTSVMFTDGFRDLKDSNGRTRQYSAHVEAKKSGVTPIGWGGTRTLIDPTPLFQ